MKAAKREMSITTDAMVGFPGETEADFAVTLTLLDEVRVSSPSAFKFRPGQKHPRRWHHGKYQSPDEEKARRLE